MGKDRQHGPEKHPNFDGRMQFLADLGKKPFERYSPLLLSNGGHVPTSGPHCAEFRKIMQPCIAAEEMARRFQNPSVSSRMELERGQNGR